MTSVHQHRIQAERRAEWFHWYRTSAAPGIVLGTTGVSIVLTACALTVMYCAHAWLGM